MAEIRLIEPTTGEIEYHIKTDLLNPPILKVKLRPITHLDTVDTYADGVRSISGLGLGRALAAIAEWDLTLDGKPLPCTDEVKAKYRPWLNLLLAQHLEESTDDYPVWLASAIVKVAQDEKSFLKN
jgi:hypothetical protein